MPVAIPRNPHDPYIHAVYDAMVGVPMPSSWWVTDAETRSDGETCDLSAVMTWDGYISPEYYPHGLLICWSLELGWQYAGVRPDGSNDVPEDLPVPLWADPADVADCAEALLAGDNIPTATRPVWHDDAVMAAVTAWEKD